MSSVLDRWPYSRRSLWIVLGALAAVVVGVVVLLVVVTGRGGAPTAEPSSTDGADQPPPTPIPVVTVVPGPKPTEVVEAAPIGDRPGVTAGPEEEATDAEITVRLVSLRPIDTQAYERGDATGPGLAATIVVTNNSDTDLDLSADINLYSGRGPDAMPAVPMSLDGHNSPFGKEKLAPGESAERTAVFATPNAAGTPVAVQVLIGGGSFSLQATVGS